MIFATSQLVLLPFAALLINLSLARNDEAWGSERRVLLWTAGLPWFGFLSFAVYSAVFVFPLGPGASAIRISYVHAVGRDLKLASDQVQP